MNPLSAHTRRQRSAQITASKCEILGTLVRLAAAVLLLLLTARGAVMHAQSFEGFDGESSVHGLIAGKGVAESALGVALTDSVHNTGSKATPNEALCSFLESSYVTFPHAVVVDGPWTGPLLEICGDQAVRSTVGLTVPVTGANDSREEKTTSVELSPTHTRDLNRETYYKNRLEFSLDGGWLPINIPFVFDVFLGDGYNKTPLNYTLVPVIASLRWQIDDVAGPWIFRGNWDVTASAAATLIPRGPETRYFAWIMGIRRNFVPRHGKLAPYFDGRLGLGDIDAKEPLGVIFAQGQDFTFTVNMGSGLRYNFNSRYSLSAGLNWMHISNLYLSEPKFANYGINVYGPMFGINFRLGKLRQHSSE